jgi:hypothetical protein
LAGAVFAPGTAEKRFWPIFLRMAAAAFLAVILALAVLTALNLTPLCVGQNNGDGTNNLVMCIVQTGLVAVFFGPLVLGLLALAAFASSLVILAAARTAASTNPLPAE